jgi:hypothetical protein
MFAEPKKQSILRGTFHCKPSRVKTKSSHVLFRSRSRRVISRDRIDLALLLTSCNLRHGSKLASSLSPLRSRTPILWTSINLRHVCAHRPAPRTSPVGDWLHAHRLSWKQPAWLYASLLAIEALAASRVGRTCLPVLILMLNRQSWLLHDMRTPFGWHPNCSFTHSW